MAGKPALVAPVASLSFCQMMPSPMVRLRWLQVYKLQVSQIGPLMRWTISFQCCGLGNESSWLNCLKYVTGRHTGRWVASSVFEILG